MQLLLKTENVELKNKSSSSVSVVPNFSVYSGDLIEIRGSNGIGKTLFLKSILGLNKGHEGKITLLTNSIGYLPQLMNKEFFTKLTLHEVICLISKKVSLEQIMKLELFEKSQDLRLSWNTASGGEKQKTLLASLLVSANKLNVFDEPFNHLDIKSQEILKRKIKLSREQGNSYLIVNHSETSSCENAAQVFVQSMPSQVKRF
jgi:ABC-type Mn2+/Zn2+ transport system ATPase subunit